eukprot:2874895-Amphidinium_carterae.2
MGMQKYSVWTFTASPCLHLTLALGSAAWIVLQLRFCLCFNRTSFAARSMEHRMPERISCRILIRQCGQRVSTTVLCGCQSACYAHSSRWQSVHTCALILKDSHFSKVHIVVGIEKHV